MWNDLITNPEIGIRFALQIQGIQQIMLDGGVPVGQDGAAWSVPMSGSYPYEYVAHALDASDIRDIGAEISRSTSEVSPGAMTFTLMDSDGELLELLAWDNGDGAAANLTESVDYDTEGDEAVILHVDDSSAFTVDDKIHLGRETLVLGYKSATTLACDRDLFSIGDEDTAYTHNESIGKAPRVVTNYPRVWVGRTVHLYGILVDQDGRALDSAWGGGNQVELWRGVIKSNPLPDGSWHRWSIQADSIDSMLSTEVGREFQAATLLRVPGSAAHNAAGSALPPVGSPMAPLVVYIDEETNKVDFDVEEWATSAAYLSGAAPDARYSYTGDDAIGLDYGYHDQGGLIATWYADLTSVVEVDTTNSVTIRLKALANGYRISAWSSGFTVTRVTFHWDSPRSIGQLLGFTGDTSVGFSTFASISSNVQPYAVFVSQTAKTIPFYLVDDSGIGVSPPPDSGYAIIGDPDDGAEVVSYSDISSLFVDAGVGIYQMTGVQRARMGTAAKAHYTLLSEVNAAPGEVAIRFATGFEDTPCLEALLQLATSTGGGHKGDYDTLEATAGAAINSRHFDIDQIIEASNGLTIAEKNVSLLITEPVKISELASELLMPLGMYLHGRMSADGEYLIGLSEVLPAMESDSLANVGAGNLDLYAPAIHQVGNDRIVNEIAVNYYWDAAKDEEREGAVITIRDLDSQTEYGKRNAIEWTLRGRQFDADAAITIVGGWAVSIFQRHAHPYDLLTLAMDRSGWLVSPGDTISLTLPGVPTADGSRGVTARLASVLKVEKLYSGETTGANVTVVLEPQLRTSTYVPCARIASASGVDVTLEANEFTQVGSDVDHFDAGDVLWCYEEQGDVSGRVSRTISSISGNVITLTAALGFTPSADSLITGGDYASVQASQRAHVHIASAATPPVLSVSTTGAFRYV